MRFTEKNWGDSLPTSWAAKPTIYYEELDSTNLEAVRLAKAGAVHGTLVIADRQTEGRGRRGRSWFSSGSDSLTMSLILRPKLPAEQVSMMTLVMALAVCHGIRQLLAENGQEAAARQCGIKWPNDILIGDRKVCGILTELHTLEEGGYILVAGVGINVNGTEFPEELGDRATSLRLAAGCPVDRERLAALAVSFFEKYYELTASAGDLEPIMDQYQLCLCGKGMPIRVLDPAGEYGGVALGITSMGELLVLKDGEGMVTINSGEISIRGRKGYF